MFKKVSILLAMVLMIISFSGCSSKKADGRSANNVAMDMATEATSSYYDAPREEEMKAEFTFTQVAPAEAGKPADQGNFGAGGALGGLEHKIIITTDISMETLEFDKSIAEITDYVNKLGGFIQSSSVTGKSLYSSALRRAYYTFRIPKQNYEGFTEDIYKFGNVLNTNTSGNDVTEAYFDTEARVKTLKIQEERLLDLLTKSGELKDIIELERTLSDIRYQIESYTGTLIKWDNLVAYTTVNVNIVEVYKPTEVAPKEPITIFEKMSQGFISSIRSISETLQELLVALVSLIPYLVIIGIIILIVINKLKLRKNNKNVQVEDNHSDTKEENK